MLYTSPTLSTATKNAKCNSYLVMVEGKPHVVFANSKPVVKNNKKQFWFNLNGKPKLATKPLQSYKYIAY